MMIGYGRVSTSEQNLDLQLDALKKAGCERIFTDKMSGTKAERPGLDEALAYAREGDSIVVWRLDRLGRSIKNLIDVIKTLEDRKVGFRSLSESLDTTTSGGRLVFLIFGALAEFEVNIIRERTRAGLAAARARGKIGGRPKSMDEKKAAALVQLYKDNTNSIDELCELFKVSRTTLYKYAKPKAIETAVTSPKI